MRRLLAIAGLTVRTAVRQRSFVSLAVALAVVVLLLPGALRDDGTLVGRARLLVTYCLGLSHGLLCLATIWLGADSLAREVAGRQMHLVAVKPIARWQIWCGKWLGLLAIDAVLLLLVGFGCAAGMRATLADPRWSDADREAARLEIVTARAELRPDTPDFAAEAEKLVTERLAAGELTADDNLLYARRALRQELEARWQHLPAGRARTWTFHEVRPPAGERAIYFRFRLRAAEAPADGHAHGRFQAVGAGGPHASEQREHLPLDSVLGFRIPSDLVGADGRLEVTFENGSGVGLAVPLVDGPTVVYRVGAFGGNLARALLLMLLQLAFLAALGLLMGGSLSFPVAAFCAVAYLVAAAHGPMVRAGLNEGEALFQGAATPLWLELAGRGLVRAGLWLTGSLTAVSPVGAVASGLAIQPADLLAAVVRLGLVQTGVVALVGLLAWARRELAVASDR